MLRIGTTGTETRFLPENELPDCARLSGNTEDEVMETSAREAEERDVQKAILASRMPQNTGQLYKIIEFLTFFKKALYC